jgi:hypothetical protein
MYQQHWRNPWGFNPAMAPLSPAANRRRQHDIQTFTWNVNQFPFLSNATSILLLAVVQQNCCKRIFTMVVSVGILSIGDMGLGVARLLKAHAYRVLTVEAGRR